MERYQKKTTKDFMTGYQGDDMGRKHKSYSYEEYKKAMELLEKGYGLTETCRILGWPETKESTLSDWKHGKHKPPVAKWTAKPCIELAYVIGVLHGDGSVCKDELRHRYIIQLAVIDKEFAEIFSKAISRLLDMNYHKPWWSEKEKKWWVVYYSKAFVEWYKRTEKQGLQGFKPYIEHDMETIKYYLRGLYDSDGSNYRNRQIRLYNSNKKLLEYVQYLLKKYFNIKATGPYLLHKSGDIWIINGVETRYNDDYYRIQIRRKEHIQKYLEKIGFTVVRRQLGLKKNEKVFVEGIGY